MFIAPGILSDLSSAVVKWVHFTTAEVFLLLGFVYKHLAPNGARRSKPICFSSSRCRTKW
jgi:hypothetical protein